MVQVKYKSPGVSAKNIGAANIAPKVRLTSVPAMIVGTSQRGPAFVPMSFATYKDFTDKFGDPFISGSITTSPDRFTSYGPLAVQEWMNQSPAVTFMRVLGAGDGKQRIKSGINAGDVTNAGFTVGEKLPDHSSSSGLLSSNSYANSNGVPGRTYFLGCFMSESLDSTLFSSAGLQGTGSVNGITNSSIPIIRGILMAPSGVIMRLSSSGGGYDSSAPSTTLVASDSTAKGTTLGSVKLFDTSNGKRLQQFVLLLNGHVGSDEYPNVITASFDIQSPDYITKVFNLTASLIQEAGHYLAAHWDIHPVVATLTGTGVVTAGADVASDSQRIYSTERSAFLITSSLSRDVGSSTVPNYEAFRDRFSHASSPWIISQKFQGNPLNLFRLHALDAGAEVSNKYKFIINNITPATIEVDTDYRYGTFDLAIRSVNDFGEEAPPLENFVDLSLDPAAPRYISKIIGDMNEFFDFDRPEDNQKIVVEGNYDNLSRYVRVEVSSDVESKSIPPECLPLGFRGMPHIITSGSSPLAPLGGNDAAALVNSNFLQNTTTQPVPFANNIVVYKDDTTPVPSNVRRWGVKLDHIDDLEKQNQKPTFNQSIDSIVKHFPKNSVNNVNFIVSDNQGSSDTVQLGIIDADRFCNNLFTLENIKVVTGSGGDIAQGDWKYASYVRNGVIETNDVEKTRRINIKDFLTGSSNSYLSFQFMLHGGFDGVNIFEVNEYNLSNAAATADMLDVNRGKFSGPTVSSYLTALKIVSEPSIVDMQILATPGIREPVITDRATEVAESRMDSLYIMDIEQVDQDLNLIELSNPTAYSTSLLPSIEKTIDRFSSRAVKSSYAATYFPDVTIRVNPEIHKIESIQVPPSVAVLGAISLNDSIGYPWYAPAGTSRGALNSTLSATVKLKEHQLDKLHSNDINPLWVPQNVGGQSSGVVVWGQKTLGSSYSLLSRINVRRLLLEIRRQARDIATSLLFESNRGYVISTFNSRMSSVLSTITSQIGLEDYLIDVNISSTTQSDIDGGVVRGKIYVQPHETTEFVSIDFIVSNNLNSNV